MKKTIATIACLLIFGISVQAAPEVSGYIDARFATGSAKGNEILASNGLVKDHYADFFVSEGALYFNHKASDKVSMFIDLPISDSNDLTLGYGKAQAYINYTLKENKTLTLGQFDTPFGYELNDSKDVALVSQGLVYAMLPVTHTGIKYDATYGKVGVTALIGNGSQAAANPDDQKHELGVRASFPINNMTISGGVLLNSYEADGTDDEMLVDIVFTGTFGPIEVGAAIDQVSNPSGSKVADDKLGLLAHIAYTAKSDCKLIGRIESVSNEIYNSTTPVIYDATKVTAGYSRKIDTALTVKAEVSMVSAKAETGDSESYNNAAVAAVYTF